MKHIEFICDTSDQNINLYLTTTYVYSPRFSQIFFLRGEPFCRRDCLGRCSQRRFRPGTAKVTNFRLTHAGMAGTLELEGRPGGLAEFFIITFPILYQAAQTRSEGHHA